MKMVNAFVFAVLMNFTLLHAGKKEFSCFIKYHLYGYESKDVPDDLDAVMIKTLFNQKISDMDTREKVSLSYELCNIIQRESENSNKILQSDLMKDIFNSIDLVDKKEIQKIQKCLSSTRDKDFTQYLSELLENNEEQSNVSLKKMFLSVLFESQLRLPVKKEKDLIPQMQDLVKTGMDLIAQDKESQNLDSSDLLNTVVISTSFKQIVDQEEGIKEEQKKLEEQTKLLNQEKEKISKILENFDTLMDHYKDVILPTLKLHLYNSKLALESQLKEIEVDFNSLLGEFNILESKKQGVRQNRVQWGSLLQEKIDEKTQKQQAAETKMQTLQRAMDEIKNEQKELTDKNELLKPSKRLLVQTNLKQALEQDIFNPQNYDTFAGLDKNDITNSLS